MFEDLTQSRCWGSQRDWKSWIDVGTGTSGPLAGEVIISHHSFLLKYVLATGIRDIAERFLRTAPVDTAPSPSRPAAPRPTAE